MENNEYFSSINDVSKRLDIPAHTLRYWEKQFPVAIKPTTGAGGRRYYRVETVNRLVVIKDLLYNRGMTIAGVKKMLRDGTFPDAPGDVVISATSPVNPGTHSAAHADDISAAITLLDAAKQILTAV